MECQHATILFPCVPRPTRAGEEGEELPDAQAAWREATVTAGQIIQDLNGRLRPDRDWRMGVTDEFANRLYVIHLYAEKPK
jgi:hypothetical protein